MRQTVAGIAVARRHGKLRDFVVIFNTMQEGTDTIARLLTMAAFNQGGEGADDKN
ncbi:MAG: hypothetical protein JJT90_15625 [Ectothiorhodospiraceae bacterium]|nr:hypothetical protein [Ectothiorhodospiraceae bacterium]